MKLAIVFVLLLLVACGPLPETVVVEEAKDVRVTRLTTWMSRVIDEEAGVVCYSGGDWGYCFLIDETKLDY